ncbi:MAG: hypothetical protein GY910_23895 [bacterium]|nr:hypothetical protein [bacterium]
MRIRPLLSLPLLFAIGGCLAPPGRIDGENYPASGPPFISDQAPRIDSEATLPLQENLIHRVVLLGDAGAPMESEPVLAALTRWADVYADDTTVIFLGDNVYPAGVEEDAITEGEEILRKQIVATTADRIFVPGNHDWGHPGRGRLMRQQEYVDANGAEFIPRDGCPGPVLRTIVAPTEGGPRGISAIVFDIDPWYFNLESVGDCPGNKTPEEMADALGEMLRTHQDQWLIVGAHHPLRTGGPHGGFTRGAVGDFITGFIYLIFGTLQDTTEEQYQEIMAPVETALASSPPAIYAAGHDHNIQVLKGGDQADFQIVSGAGATVRVSDGDVTDIEGTLFAHGHAGFVVVDFVRTDEGERALLHVVETGHDAPVFSMDLGMR